MNGTALNAYETVPLENGDKIAVGDVKSPVFVVEYSPKIGTMDKKSFDETKSLLLTELKKRYTNSASLFQISAWLWQKNSNLCENIGLSDPAVCEPAVEVFEKLVSMFKSAKDPVVRLEKDCDRVSWVWKGAGKR